jgi:MoxR-like ATPase
MSILRQPAEVQYAAELEILRKADTLSRPISWLLSPKAVVDFICGVTLADGTQITAKYIGPRRIIEVAVATLLTDRALLLIGLPGTAKSFVSELLAAAISGRSTRIVQGTAGTQEDALRYGWNYARLIAQGPDIEALVASPVMQAMNDGTIVRLEELTRLASDVQDALITLLSEKMMPIPELNTFISAQEGFNLIATANDRDRGVNDLSSALRRRFNTVVLPLPATLEEETAIVEMRVAQLSKSAGLPPQITPIAEIKRLVTIFRELRSGRTIDEKLSVKSPSSTLSPAEAISVVMQGQMLAWHFGQKNTSPTDMAHAMEGAIIKDEQRDRAAWQEYLSTVVKKRKEWQDIYEVFSTNDAK